MAYCLGQGGGDEGRGVDADGVEDGERAVAVVQKQGEFGAAEDNGIGAVLIAQTADYILIACQCLGLHYAKFEFRDYGVLDVVALIVIRDNNPDSLAHERRLEEFTLHREACAKEREAPESPALGLGAGGIDYAYQRNRREFGQPVEDYVGSVGGQCADLGACGLQGAQPVQKILREFVQAVLLNQPEHVEHIQAFDS